LPLASARVVREGPELLSWGTGNAGNGREAHAEKRACSQAPPFRLEGDKGQANNSRWGG
jgi:hypothetical protein